MNRRTTLAAALSAQRGMVLVISLLLMLVLSIGVLPSMQLITVETRVAANMHNQEVAFQVAEGAVRTAEVGLARGDYTGFAANTGGLYTLDAKSVPVWAPAPWAAAPLDWSGSGAVQTSVAGQTGAFVIEQLPSVAKKGSSLSAPAYGSAAAQTRVYRITARGVGLDGKRAVMVQTIVHD